MIRSLAAITFLALAVAGCSPPSVEKTPAAALPSAAPSAGPKGYNPARSATLEAVRKRGYLSCGVHPGLPGFALLDPRGEWRGFDVDICRAVAAAVSQSQARRIRISLRETGGEITLTVRHNGSGRLQQVPVDDLALRLMSYCARRIGGRIEVRPRTKSGMVLTCGFPRPDKS